MSSTDSDHEPRHFGKTVLVVDDSAMVRSTVRSALISDGFDVCGEANNGREAIDLAERLSPDLIILDVSMPVMNGLQAAPHLRKVLPSPVNSVRPNGADHQWRSHPCSHRLTW